MIKLTAVGLTMEAIAIAAASDRHLVHVQPVVDNFLGYEFEWGPMVAGSLACLAVRLYMSKT